VAYFLLSFKERKYIFKRETMEFTHEEKERIIAEEKLRHQAIKELQAQGGGKCCSSHTGAMGIHGCCHCGGILKGVILGLVLAALFCFFFDRHHGGNGWGRCPYNGSPMMSSPDSQGQTK
jgi:hypothetical protein